MANIYNEVAAAVKAAGANTRLYTNEYNVLQYSTDPKTAAPDDYAGWYLNYVNSLKNAGGAVSGIGVEFYVNTDAGFTGAMSPARITKAMQNLSVAGMPLSLTEFGEETATNNTVGPLVLTDLLTMMYGTQQVTTFGDWDWGGPGEQNGAGPYTSQPLFDANWNLTVDGLAYQKWMSQWDVNDMLTTDANGDVNFTGTYGTYDVTINGVDYTLTLNKGTTGYTLTNVALPEPAALAAVTALVMLVSRRRRSAA